MADNTCTVFVITTATTATSGVPNPGCGGAFPRRDLWYGVVVPTSANLRFEVRMGGDFTIWNASLAVYRSNAGCNGPFSLLGCATTSGTGFIARLDLASPAIAAAETLYVRVYNDSGTNGDPGQALLCITDRSPVAPPNDNPCGALPLAPWAEGLYGNNLGATATSGIPAPGCGNYVGADVWYKTVVPSGGALQVGLTNGSLGNGRLAAYRPAAPCGTFTLVQCDEINGPGFNPELNMVGLTPGDSLYIRVWRAGGGTGTFTLYSMDLGIYDGFNDCAQALAYCGDDLFYQHLFGHGTDDFANPANGKGCLGPEYNSAWIRFRFQDTTTFRFTVKPLHWVDYDWALYGPVNGCNALGQPVRCSFTEPNVAAGTYFGDNNYTGMHPAATDTTEGSYDLGQFTEGDNFVKPLKIRLADLNRDFYLRVQLYGNNKSGFELDVHNTAQPANCVSLRGNVVLRSSKPQELQGHRHGNTARLQWQADAYEGQAVQARQLSFRTSDAQSWQQVALLEGPQATFSHRVPDAASSDTWYYQLHTLLPDGTQHASNVLALVPAQTSDRLKLLATTQADHTHILLQGSAPLRGHLQLQNLLGQVVLSQTIDTAADTHSLHIPHGHLPGGHYLVRLTTAQGPPKALRVVLP